ncbi:hypothetical protein GWI33_000090 [Rhynchophorus ferrugineus]|uniref:xanthine dehydrogenase n=1 Tax=Rhynchophorus ferrugineus TaxID=354439 RepID=A0A834IXG7_RHYFE|nr:hypothetical protein GWI33_000090 [Rhynchophorus ferrugineus]
MEQSTSALTFFVNGKKIQDDQVDPEQTLLQYLRTKLRLCGTKLGCGEGGCGACTVMVSRYDRDNRKEVHIPVNACLAPVCSMHGMAVTTVEGIGSTRTRLHPVQERIAKAHGSQCGFCTPGFVMSMYTLLRQMPKPNWDDLEEAFQGNLCRCTGYRPIAEGFKTFLEPWETTRNGREVNGRNGVCGLGDKCCKVTGTVNGVNGTSQDESMDERLFKVEQFIPYHPTQEPIFPPELKLYDLYDRQNLIIKGKNVTWYRPTSFNDLLDLKFTHPDARIIVGNTEVGVETKFKKMFYPVLIQPCGIRELNGMEETETGVRIGASVTLTELRNYLKEQIGKQPTEKTRIFTAIVDMLFWFAGKQIRSVGAIGGNIMTGSPISDMLPILMASRVVLDVYHKRNGRRKVVLDNNFFTGYRKTLIQPDEVLEAIHIPFSNEHQYLKAYKQARRREDDIAIVNAAVNVSFVPNTNTVSMLRLAFGGMSFKTVTALRTEENLVGKPWLKSTLKEACSLLLEDLPLSPSAPGGMIQYRKSLVLSLFTKAFIAIAKDLQGKGIKSDLDLIEFDGATELSHVQQKSSQYFTVVPDKKGTNDLVAKPLVHSSAMKQATGEAVYCDDLPFFENELFLAFVTSTKPYAKVLSVDYDAALQLPGVRGIVSAEDLASDKNVWGCVTHDEKVFYNDQVTSQGQIIIAVVADDPNIARKATQLVKVEYEDLSPVLITIEDAIEHESYFGNPHKVIERGHKLDEVFRNAPHILEGQCRMGGQEHFYFETHGLIVVPKGEDDEMDIYSSTQNPTELQLLTASVLGVHQNKINCIVKRLGGGFGGKETKAAVVGLPVAVAARKFQRPVRCILDRDEDMVMTGGRHPILMKYKVAFDKRGQILGCEADLYLNGGYSQDLSWGVCERALSHFENAYYIPACKVTGRICKTNIHSATAFRGFGGPQGMFLAESIIQHISEYLNIERHLDCTVEKCWKECIKMSDFYKRKDIVEKFNRQHRYKKRGISVIPTKFGIAFGTKFLNQAGALVNIYMDGTVLLHHAGIEMGQGLYTKMLQVTSKSLDIPIELIHTKGHSTDVVPNSSPTAASTGSDLNGMAILDACNQLNERLRPYKLKNPNGKWKDWVKTAYFDRVCLSAAGFYKTPNIGHDWVKNEGNLYGYFTYGAACSEVEIDTLTGDHRVLRTDIVMDLGESLNPAIDVGQVEGAFMQGYGLFVLEELVYSPTGTLFTRGPGTYKIPGFADIPAEFNVSLLKGASNPRAVYSSKAVGEPPLFLASSVLFAIKSAIIAARTQNGVCEFFTLDSPATAAKIRMACTDSITSQLNEPTPGSFTPWNVIV